MMAVIGYIVYCIFTLWVCAAGIFISLFDGDGRGSISTEAKCFLAVALVLLYGAYRFFPFTVGLK